MEYKVTAYRASVGSTIELADGVVPAGVLYPKPEGPLPSAVFYIICLEPVEEKGSEPSGTGSEEAEESKESKEGDEAEDSPSG